MQKFLEKPTYRTDVFVIYEYFTFSFYRLDESSSSTLSEDYRPPTSRAAKPRYYFQPNAGADQSVIEAHFRENQGPLPGQLLPMAIPLGKPRMDPALRLPLCIDEGRRLTSGNFQ